MESIIAGVIVLHVLVTIIGVIVIVIHVPKITILYFTIDIDSFFRFGCYCQLR